MDIVPQDFKKEEENDESLTLVHQNIRGLTKKINEFISMLTLERINPQVICFSEHHMTESNLNLLNVSNYTISTGFCRQNFQKGGVCIYVRRDLCCRSIDLTKYCEEKNYEVCAIQIRSRINSQIIIICIYRSPTGSFARFLKLLDIMLKSLYQPKIEFIICGDINVDYLSDNLRKRQLTQLIESYNISHLVDFPTRVQHNHISAIDNIFINNTLLQHCNILPIQNGLSDHDAQYLLVKNLHINIDQTSGKYKRIVTADKIGYFQKLLMEETWETIYQEKDVNNTFNTFLRLYLNMYEASFPIVYCKKYTHNDNAWITSGIRTSCKTKRNLYLSTRSCNDPKVIWHYKNYCNILRRTIREAKRRYFNEIIVNSENKTKTSWKIIKKLANKNHHNRQALPPIKIDGIQKSPKQVAQDINNYFINIPKNLNIQAPRNNNCIALLRKYYPDVYPPLQIVPVTEGEIRSTINSMKPKNSSGYDGISIKILKLCGRQISKPLAFIIEKSIQTGVFPERLKYANITPIYKSGDRSDVANYRPISLLPAFSKIFERSMYSRLNQHLQANNILATEQYGFRKGLSTEQATYSLTNNILMAWNEKTYIGGIFCDLTKAFDCVDHDLLMAKLKHYGIQDVTFNWLKSYLMGRKQRVKISVNENQTNYSSWETVKQGVPQGSVLGPLLFTMYINDLPRCVSQDSKAILFADDTSVLVKDKDYNKFKQKMNLTLTSLDQWFTANQLVLNVTKTNIIKFEPKTRGHLPLIIPYKDQVLEEVNSAKFLGIYVDNNMNWKKHIEQISHKLNVACSMIRNLTNTLNADILRMVYYAYFHPIILYGVIFWGNSTHAHQIFKLQKRVIRIMSGTGPRSSCRNLYKKLRILPVPCQYILSLMLFVIGNQQNFYTNEYVHGMDTRKKNHMHLPNLSLTGAQKGVLYSGAKIYNNLPRNIQNYKGDKKKFKKELIKYLNKHTFYSITEFLELETNKGNI